MSWPTERIDPGTQAVGAVLAAGLGSRIGGEKAMVEISGRPLISYPLAALKAAGLEPLVIAKRDSALPALDCQVIREDGQLRHPLCGVLSALRHSGGRAAVVLGCDMPLVTPALLSWLASRPEPLIAPSLGGRTQPFPARYGRSVLAALELALAAELSMRRALDSLRPRLIANHELAHFGDPARLLFNVNSPEDLTIATNLLERSGD